MSNRNYNKMYGKPVVEAKNTAELETGTEVQMAIEGVAEPEIVPAVKQAVVVNCARLNVRKEPSPTAPIVAEIPVSSEVEVYENESVDNYYKICTAIGAEGYCVKDYLKLK